MIPAPIRPSPLWKPEFEHDACGVGFIANLGGERTHGVIEKAVAGLKNLAHRGAIDADAVTGDGAGILTEIPYELLADFLAERGKHLYSERDLAVCVIFLPRDNEYAQAHGKHLIEENARREGLTFLAWREVPVDPTCLGKKAEMTRPLIFQGLFARKDEISDARFERRCYLAMKGSGRDAAKAKLPGFYTVSFSSRTITYKGLLNAPQLRRFYVDLKNPRYLSPYAIFHQRFATNTFPDWTKAQPFRMLAHNGEINTIRGNRNLMLAREFSPAHGVWGERFVDVRPIIQPDMSDSASFDNALQLITVAGRTVVQSISMMMPPAWEKDDTLAPEVRDFYRYHSTIIEPWDGPAAMCFTDGRFVGATLDRNGLRPLRYKLYEDGTLICASEAGLIPEWGSKVIRNGRLGPGRMIAVDLERKQFLGDIEIKSFLSHQANYSAWCRNSLFNLHALAKAEPVTPASIVPADRVDALQVAFRYDLEERELILLPMAARGEEAIGSMGDDTPLAALSRRPRLFYTYFKQLFAQVTNPAIDPLRESLIMSTQMYLGGRLGLFEGMHTSRRFIELDYPVLLPSEYAKLLTVDFLAGRIVHLDATWDASTGEAGLEPAVQNLARLAREAVQMNGATLLVVSDRAADRHRAAMPMLLAIGAVHQELVRAGLRLKADLLALAGDARDVHQIACLLGFGANAVYPYLGMEVMSRLALSGAAGEGISPDTAMANYRKALTKGLMKIMSKMGISTLFSYQAAQIFEALGVSKKVVEDCFVGTATPISGIGYPEIAEEVLRRHAVAFPDDPATPVEIGEEGYYKVKKKGEGEVHGWSPKVVTGMNRFLKKEGDYEAFSEFKEAAEVHPPVTIKDLLQFKSGRPAVPLEEVEPIEDIRRRFTTAGMSLGALSPEAHEALAIAMNRIGGKSNSGEGGEDPRRFYPYENGDLANSAIKQVASGRFGVTAEYLASASEIEIKVAQGAKPGEGGQLPGHKVSPLIARLRFSVPGVTLISPPPHHDIYSIEDLAQLIFDLKEVNPRAKVCVKLVSSSGVGTVAAGVAKAYADVILISGHEGGTGASPMSSIKNAGSSWEIGLAEAHQVLMMSDLRGRVVLRTDGGMKTGRDIVIAAILGAEEYNFGTAALIAAGCAMFRVCHLNTCPVGVATQRDDLRAKFRGKPENVIQYFNAVAEDVRRLLAKLGYRSLDEIIGRVALLTPTADPENPKSALLDLSGLLHDPDPTGEIDRVHTRERNDRFPEGSLDDQILQEANSAIRSRGPNFTRKYKIANTHRCVGTRISGEIAYIHGSKGLPAATLDLTFSGSAGQSFGTFLVQGVRLRLIGEANDYVGKGMNGGEIIVRPKDGMKFIWHENILLGNTCLYGATGGYLFAAGRAGERFAVRNSGALAVVEGIGDHGCEYMTRGTIVVLGATGRNFGAGMSGGLAYVYDEDGLLAQRYNAEMVELTDVVPGEEAQALRRLVEYHHRVTTSPRAAELLENWEMSLRHFRKVAPRRGEADLPVDPLIFDEARVGEGTVLV